MHRPDALSPGLLLLWALFLLPGPGCGRDLTLPDEPSALQPTELGSMAGYYQMTTPDTIEVDGERSPVTIPVSGIGIVQHLALPPGLAEGAGGDPVVVGLVQPRALDLSNSRASDGTRTIFAFGGAVEGKIAAGKVVRSELSSQGDFTVEPLPGAGLLVTTLDGCPGLPAFDDAAPLYLERSCRFAPSRSGVYAGCSAGCAEGCDPKQGASTHFMAMGFTPLAGQSLDLVIATSFWTTDGQEWIPNLTVGLYDRFETRGVGISVDVVDSQPRPETFSLQEQEGFLDLDVQLGQRLSPPGQKLFTQPSGGTDLASWEMNSACGSEAHVRRAVGGLEARCNPTPDTLSLVITEARHKPGGTIVVTVELLGVGALSSNTAPAGLLGLLRSVGLRPSATLPVVPTDQVLEVIARAAPSGRVLDRASICSNATACFTGLGGASGVEVRASIRIHGAWSICPKWPSEPSCEDTVRVDREVKVPLVSALPVCVLP